MADENNSVGATNGGDFGGALVSGLFNVGSGFLNNYFGKKVSKKEYQRAIELWNMQNEYNKPINQMARLREAGLNPNLAYGQLSNSVAGSAHAPSRENMSFPNLDLVGAYQDLRQRDAMTQQVKAQTEVAKEQKKYIKQQTNLLKQEVKENDDNDTSRATPYPVKLTKQVIGNAKKVSDKIAGKGQDLPIWGVFDYFDRKFIDFTRQRSNVPTVSGWIRGR